MIYRRTRAADRKEIREMMKRFNLKYDEREPMIGFTAEDSDDGSVKGVSYAHKAAIIDPFICEIPLAGRTLLSQTEGAISALELNTTLVQVKYDNQSLIKILSTLGYEMIPKGYIIMKKVV